MYGPFANQQPSLTPVRIGVQTVVMHRDGSSRREQSSPDLVRHSELYPNSPFGEQRIGEWPSAAVWIPWGDDGYEQESGDNLYNDFDRDGGQSVLNPAKNTSTAQFG